MKSLIFYSFVLCLVFLVSSCGSSDRAQQTGDKFLRLLLKEKYDAASRLADPVALRRNR